jgi:uncharacterized protein (DUF1810 family)
MSVEPTPGLERFVEAQEKTYEQAKAELAAGHKRTHWIWWILPIIQKAEKPFPNDSLYSIKSLDEVREYLAHPVLGPRLIEIVNIILSQPDAKIDYLMGKQIDSIKLQSCMTLFSLVSPGDVFDRVLDHFFGGQKCQITLSKMAPESATKSS